MKTSKFSFQLSINNSVNRVIPCQLTQNPEFLTVRATDFLIKINVETSFKFTPYKHQLTSQSEEHQASKHRAAILAKERSELFPPLPTFIIPCTARTAFNNGIPTFSYNHQCPLFKEW